MDLTKKLLNRLYWHYYLWIKRDPHYLSFDRWVKDHGPGTLRFNYSLSENSLVFDVGGYRGCWSAQIVRMYNPYIHVFEPVPQFCSLIEETFKRNKKIRILNFGLSDVNEKRPIYVRGESSSLFKVSGRPLNVSLVDIVEFMVAQKISVVDLMKINIEGAEYPLLRRLISSGFVEKCRDIQVQFHHWMPDAVRLRREILDSLRRTHYPTWEYPFVWENWRRKE